MAKKNFKNIVLPPKYVPKKSEPYMCPEQLAYFYQLLTAEKMDVLNNGDSAVNAALVTGASNDVGDTGDDAASEQEFSLNVRLSQRDDNLVRKIDAALARMDDGTYGYSIVSGEEIGLQRMLARPLATMTTEEQEEYERNK